MELTGLSEQLMEQQVLLVSCRRMSKLPEDCLEMSLLYFLPCMAQEILSAVLVL